MVDISSVFAQKCAFASFKCSHTVHTVFQAVRTKNVFIRMLLCVCVCVCVPPETTGWISSQAALSYPRPCTLHPSPIHIDTQTHTHTAPSSQRLGPRVNGCSTFPLSRSAKNYLLNDVCINIIYMVISLLLITAGPSAARGVGWSCVKLICQGKIWW